MTVGQQKYFNGWIFLLSLPLIIWGAYEAERLSVFAKEPYVLIIDFSALWVIGVVGISGAFLSVVPARTKLIKEVRIAYSIVALALDCSLVQFFFDELLAVYAAAECVAFKATTQSFAILAHKNSQGMLARFAIFYLWLYIATGLGIAFAQFALRWGRKFLPR